MGKKNYLEKAKAKKKQTKKHFCWMPKTTSKTKN